MTAPTEHNVCRLIEAGQIAEAVALTRDLSASHVYRDLIYTSAHENPTEEYLTFVLASAKDRAGTLDEINFIDHARAFLVTALAPLDNAHARAYELHLQSIELMRSMLEQDVSEVEFFRSTPGKELDAATAERLQSFADALKQWKL
jgi:hypothetical protein